MEIRRPFIHPQATHNGGEHDDFLRRVISLALQRPPPRILLCARPANVTESLHSEPSCLPANTPNLRLSALSARVTAQGLVKFSLLRSPLSAVPLKHARIFLAHLPRPRFH